MRPLLRIHQKYLLTTLFVWMSCVVVAQAIKLPVEVIGEQGKVVTRTVQLDQATVGQAERLWMQVNNLSYENKGSVKINDQAWYDLNHESVDMHYQEEARGGMVHGGFNTIRLSIPVAGLTAGENIISFRFNRSDGISNGYRVVTFNLLDGAGNSLLVTDTFEEEDPFEWEPPYTDATSIAEGKELWESATLWSNYLEEDTVGKWYAYDLQPAVEMKATCADCHVSNGYDLEYFSYSNESIIERTKFHLLSEEEGKKIASYIRSLSDEIDGLERYGRPWNPPYQPGPSLADKSIDEWAAGAGLDAVLEKDEDMLAYMFPNGIDSTTIAAYFDSDKMEDRTLTPLAVQLPDWKHWLPLVHPMDAFSKDNYYHTTTVKIQPREGLKRITEYLNAMPLEDRDKSELQNELRIFHRHFRHFMDQTEGEVRHWRTGGDAVRNNRYNDRVAHIPDEIPIEMAVTSLARLLAVKNFEFMNVYELRDKAKWFAIEADYDELTPRGWQWVGIDYNVFEVPPHFTSCITTVNCDEFVGQPRKTGHYESTAWYQLQLVLNGGNGNTGGNDPMDWQYQLDFIKRSSSSSGIYEPIRYYHSLNSMYQLRTNEKNKGPNSGRGFRARQQLPHWFYGLDDNNSFSGFEPGAFPALLDEIQPGMQRMVLDALLRQFLREMDKPENDLSKWDRRAPHGGANELEPASKSGDLINIESKLGLYYYTDKMYYLIPRFAALGVDCDIINGLIDWSAEAWPNYDWEQFRTHTTASVILAYEQDEACNPVPEIFEAVSGNLGQNPTYVWTVNDVRLAEATAKLEYTGLQPGDVLRVRVVSDRPCVDKKEATATYIVPQAEFDVMVSKNGGDWTLVSDMNVCDNDVISLKVDMPFEPLLWLDAYQLNEQLADGEQVAQWGDRSGNGYEVVANTEALKPYFDKNGFNGLPAVMFGMNDNADGLRLFTTEQDDFMEEDWTMALVGQQQGINNWADVIGNKTESKYDDGWFMRFSENGRTEISAGGGYYGGNSYELPFDFVAVMTKKGREVSFYLNGQFERSLTMEDGEKITTAYEIFLGLSDKGNANSGRYHKGPITEVMFYDYAMEPSERNLLEGYLSHRWEIGNQLPNAHPYMAASPLAVSAQLPNTQEVTLSSTASYEYVVSSELQGQLTFSSMACSLVESSTKIAYTYDPALTTAQIGYVLDTDTVATGNQVVVRSSQSLALFPAHDYGDYQWEQPNGQLLPINEIPELVNLSNQPSMIGSWKLHLGLGSCYANLDQELAFEVIFSDQAAHEIQVSVSGNGQSSLEGTQLVNDGNNLSVLLTPAAGHQLSAIRLDGVLQAFHTAPGEAYQFDLTQVTQSHQLEVSFDARVNHEVTVSWSDGGVASKTSGTHLVYEGDDWEVVFDPLPGHRLSSVTIDGQSVGALSKITLEDVRSAHQVSAYFDKHYYQISVNAGVNGSISPSGTAAYAYGSQPEFTIIPDDQYEIDKVIVDGEYVGQSSSYQFAGITSSHSITASFKRKIIYHTITVEVSEGGAISPGDQTLLEGKTATFAISPFEGYELRDVFVDGRSVGIVSSYTFTKIKDSHSIRAVFKPLPLPLHAGVEAFSIYPNPATDHFYLKTSEQLTGVVVHTLSGREVAIDNSDDFKTVRLLQQVAGEHLLLVTVRFSNGNTETTKVVLK